RWRRSGENEAFHALEPPIWPLGAEAKRVGESVQGWSANPATAEKMTLSLRAGRVNPARDSPRSPATSRCSVSRRAALARRSEAPDHSLCSGRAQDVAQEARREQQRHENPSSGHDADHYPGPSLHRLDSSRCPKLAITHLQRPFNADLPGIRESQSVEGRVGDHAGASPWDGSSAPSGLTHSI